MGVARRRPPRLRQSLNAPFLGPETCLLVEPDQIRPDCDTSVVHVVEEDLEPVRRRRQDRGDCVAAGEFEAAIPAIATR